MSRPSRLSRPSKHRSRLRRKRVFFVKTTELVPREGRGSGQIKTATLKGEPLEQVVAPAAVQHVQTRQDPQQPRRLGFVATFPDGDAYLLVVTGASVELARGRWGSSRRQFVVTARAHHMPLDARAADSLVLRLQDNDARAVATLFDELAQRGALPHMHHDPILTPHDVEDM